MIILDDVKTSYLYYCYIRSSFAAKLNHGSQSSYLLPLPHSYFFPGEQNTAINSAFRNMNVNTLFPSLTSIIYRKFKNIAEETKVHHNLAPVSLVSLSLPAAHSDHTLCPLSTACFLACHALPLLQPILNSTAKPSC